MDGWMCDYVIIFFSKLNTDTDDGPVAEDGFGVIPTSLISFIS